MTSYDYILAHFLTLHQVASLSGVPFERIMELQAAGCLPGPAYRVQGECRITSVFGEHVEPLEHGYYPRSHVTKVQALARVNEPLEMLAAREEDAFRAGYRRKLVDLDARHFGLEHLFDGDGHVAGSAADELLTSEWRHYLNGTYGLCTRTASVSDIATKEIMIARIKFLTDEGRKDAVNVDRGALVHAVDALDAVSAPFAPHEAARSSRETYINKIREKYLAG